VKIGDNLSLHLGNIGIDILIGDYLTGAVLKADGQIGIGQND
jgi:hypothetical protein